MLGESIEDEPVVLDEPDTAKWTTLSNSELEEAREIQRLEDELRAESRPSSPPPEKVAGSQETTNQSNILSDAALYIIKERERRTQRRKRMEYISNIFNTHSLLRWPILLGIGIVICLELLGYAIVRFWIYVWEKYIVGYFVALYMPTKRQRRRFHQSLEKAKTYDEWKSIAQALDKLQNKEQWKEETGDDELFDESLIMNVRNRLQQSQDRNDMNMLMKYLQIACKSNLGGISNDVLYRRTYYGTKRIVREYVRQVISSLRAVGDSNDVSLSSKKHFFRVCSKAYGQTALCLSGGSTFAFYHLGVIQSLLERRLLPTVIAGTSAGSLLAAMLCVRKDDELGEILCPDIWKHLDVNDEPYWVMLKRLVREGSLWDIQRWEKKLYWATKGPTTFLEAYRHTGRILNITVIPTDKHAPAILLNYKTAPNVVIYSAILASAAIPILVNAAELQVKTENGEIVPYHAIGKRWRDGSFKTDIPSRALHQLFNVNYTIVSQANPHIIPFLFESRGSGGKPSLHRSGTGWRGGFLASSLEVLLKLDMLKWLRLLRNLDLLPPFIGQDSSYLFLQKFHGTCTIYPKPLFRDYMRIVKNPDYDELVQKIEVGRRMTFPKMYMLYDRIAIEREIYIQLCRCRDQYKEEKRKQQQSSA